MMKEVADTCWHKQLIVWWMALQLAAFLPPEGGNSIWKLLFVQAECSGSWHWPRQLRLFSKMKGFELLLAIGVFLKLTSCEKGNIPGQFSIKLHRQRVAVQEDLLEWGCLEHVVSIVPCVWGTSTCMLSCVPQTSGCYDWVGRKTRQGRYEFVLQGYLVVAFSSASVKEVEAWPAAIVGWRLVHMRSMWHAQTDRDRVVVVLSFWVWLCREESEVLFINHQFREIPAEANAIDMPDSEPSDHQKKLNYSNLVFNLVLLELPLCLAS